MKEIDLVLSGSGTRFPLFAGGLQALDERGMEIKRVAGTSGGAIIASCIACGFTTKEIQSIILDLDFRKFKDFSIIEFLLHFGVFKGALIENYLDKLLEHRTFSDTNMELKIIATDFLRGQFVIFSKDTTPDIKLSQAIRYSISIPLVFGYRKYKDTYLVDGLLSSNYALDIFDDNERPTIGLRTGETKKDGVIPERIQKFNMIQYVFLCIQSLINSVEKEHIEDAYWATSILIDSTRFSSLKFDLSNTEKQEMMDVGYETVFKQIGLMME